MKNWGRFLITILLSLSLVLRFDPYQGHAQAPPYGALRHRREATLPPLGAVGDVPRDFNLVAQIPTSRLVPHAQREYQLGNYIQAIELLEQAKQAYQNQPLQRSQVLALTSLAQQQLGFWRPARQNIDVSFTLIASVPSSNSKTQVLAQIWNTQGHYFFSRQQHQQALSDWQQAEQLYRQIDDAEGIFGTLLDQAQALEKLGFYPRSCNRILAALEQPEYSCKNLTPTQTTTIIKQAESAAAWQIDGLNSLGNSLLLMGRLNSAKKFIEASRSLVSARTNPITKAKILFSLGNINQAIAYRSKAQQNFAGFASHSRKAIQYFQQVCNQSTPGIDAEKFLAQLNQLSLLIVSEKWSQARRLANTIELPHDGKGNLYGEVKFANNLKLLKQQNLSLKYSWRDIVDIYLNVIQQAQQIEAHRIESYAWGYLGQLQQTVNLELGYTSEELFKQALILAQAGQAPEIAYRWQWQLGRIYRQQGQREQAIALYQTSLANLDDLRSDLGVLEREVQFDFQEQIEPVYRELADLLLTNPVNNTNIELARNVIEALQVAELDDYFQDACTTFEPKSIEKIDRDAAVIYTIVLPKRLEVIVATSDNYPSPHQTFYRHTQNISQAKLEQTIQQLRQYITEPDRTKQVQQLSAQIYTWLLKPLMPELEKRQSQTLVFVLDGMLQTIPMSVLYDGEKYLIQKYAIALTPGLRLLNPKPSSDSASLLAGGISRFIQVADQSFAALSGVNDELNNLDRSTSQILLNEEFTEVNLLQQLNSTSASRLHLATHGQFNADPEKSFLLLWQKILTIKEFSALLYDRIKALLNPLDLLVLSACDTAAGDRRAALGLAGIAIRSGSLSTLATLWQVQDDSTAELMKYFYRQLENNGKAEALRQAQLELWQTADKDWQVPAFWAAYVMIGNWQ